MTGYAYSQETSLATFQETAQVIIDKSISQNVTASIALQSTSIQEIKIPVELEQKIRENDRITSIVVTNQNRCILGVFDESCIIINIARDPANKGIFEIQNSTKMGKQTKWESYQITVVRSPDTCAIVLVAFSEGVGEHPHLTTAVYREPCHNLLLLSQCLSLILKVPEHTVLQNSDLRTEY